MHCDTHPAEVPPRVLVVDDLVLERTLIRHRLRPEKVELIEAADGRSAIELARSSIPDLILLDVQLPDLSGYDVIRLLKENAATRSIPVIFVSSFGSTEDKVRALDLGASDFITKPFDAAELRARVRVCLRLKYYQDLLERQAHLDALTGLANRHALERSLDAEWSACRRRDTSLSLLIVDLDHFKRINDLFGHAAGDEALRRAAMALRSVARETDLVARFGGEEFVLVAPDCDFRGAIGLGGRIREQVEAIRMEFGGVAVKFTASVGLATMDFTRAVDEDLCPQSLVRRGDLALYHAKASGRNVVCAWEMASPDPVVDGRPCIASS